MKFSETQTIGESSLAAREDLLAQFLLDMNNSEHETQEDELSKSIRVSRTKTVNKQMKI